MHELSLALEICRIAEAQVGPGDAARITEVAVEVGRDGGVETSSLRFCLESLLAHRPFGRARPVLTLVPGDDLRVAYLDLDDDETAAGDPAAPHIGEAARPPTPMPAPALSPGPAAPSHGASTPWED